MAQNRFLGTTTEDGGAAPQSGGNRFLEGGVTDDTVIPSSGVEEGGSGGSVLPAVAAGAAGLTGAAWLGAKLKNAPGILGKIGKAAEIANAARQQLMLSGLALPKSALGNVGAAVEQSVTRGSMRPLKELFSAQTVKDAARAYKQGAQGINSGYTLPGPTPGRIMGSLDEATQAAMKRAGLSDADAANAVLQTPLGANYGRMGETLESPLARYVLPFRRTPFNQFIEMFKRAEAARQGDVGARRAAAVYGATGALHGAATADDDMPLSVPLAIAASARQGGVYGLAAMAARAAAGGRTGGGIAGSVLPVSEYGVEQAMTDPTKPFRKPAAMSALERLTK